MIQTQIVNGQKAQVVYLTDDFEPVDKAAATMAKVLYANGMVQFLNLGSAVKKYNPNHDERGRFAEGPGGGDDELGSMALGGEARNITATTRKVDALRQEMGANDMPPQQRRALDMYTQDSADFNRPGFGPVASTETKALDDLVDSHTLPRDMTVYRRVGWHRTNEILNHAGDAFSDPGFMSTTADKSKIDKPGSYIEIQVPKGSKAFPLGSLSNFPEEAEILFPRNSRLQIISHEPRSAPNTQRFVARLVA